MPSENCPEYGMHFQSLLTHIQSPELGETDVVFEIYAKGMKPFVEILAGG